MFATFKIRPLFVKDVLELVKVSHKYTVDLPAQVSDGIVATVFCAPLRVRHIVFLPWLCVLV